MTNIKPTCRNGCFHEPIRIGRYFAFQEVIAIVPMEDLMTDGFFNGWHKDASGTPRLKVGDHMRVYQCSGTLGETSDNLVIHAEGEFVVTFSELNDVRVKLLGKWLEYEVSGDAVVKWNPGKKSHEVLVDGEFVEGFDNKPDALSAAEGLNQKAA